jgi:hypothetical protein
MQIVMADESGFAGDGYFAMAGYVADHELWAAFDPYWNAILRKHGVDHFHMKDFAHARGAFEGWDEDRRRPLMADLLEIVTSAPIRAIGAENLRFHAAGT